MALIFWGLFPVWVVAIAGFWLGRYLWIKYRRPSGQKQSLVPIAHSHRLRSLPQYQAALKRYELLLRAVTILMTLALLIGILVSLRPARVSLVTPASQSRDVMLCLDVSGSLLRTDTKIINRFTALVNGHDGQRVGLTVFNSSSIVLLPLSDDYELINAQLKKTAAALALQVDQDFIDITSGTLADFDRGTSLVSDGLASCINNLGPNPLKRSQSIILATDNEVNGTPIMTLTQSVVLAQKQGAHIYVIDPGESDNTRKGDHTSLPQMATATGGKYYRLSDNNAIKDIVSDVADQEAKYSAGIQVVAVSDAPTIFIYLIVLTTLAGLAVAWRLRL